MTKLHFILSILLCSFSCSLTGTTQGSFFSTISSPTTANESIPTDLDFWSFQAQESPDQIGKQHGLVFKSQPQVIRNSLSVAIESTQFLRQFEIYAVCEGNSEMRRQLLIKASPVLTDWKVLTWKLPDNFKNESIVFEVHNIKPIHESTQFSFSSPFETKPQALPIELHKLLGNLVLGLFSLGILFLPAIALLPYLEDKIKKSLYFPISCVLVATFSLLVFWSYFLHSYLGIAITLILYSITLLQLASSRNYLKKVGEILSNSDLKNPIYLIMLSYLVVIASGFLYGGWDTPNETAQIRYLQTSLPHDNILPYIFTERFFQDQPVTPFYHGWLSSDRPPLQVAMILLLRAFFWSPEIQYHATSVILQCLLTPTVYMLARGKGVSTTTAFTISLSLVFTSSFLLNGLFVWPKLLPAAFMILNTVFLFSPKFFFFKNQERLRSICLGTTTTLSMLAHGGSLIGIVPLYIIGFFFGKLPAIRYWGWIFLPFIAGMTPWILYQKLFDPPGNRLVLWHLGGFYQKTDLSPLHVIIDQYRELGWSNWVHNKIENLKSIWGNWDVALLHLHPLQSSNGYHLLRSGMFLSAGIALFPQLMILPLILISMFNHRCRKALQSNSLELSVFVLGILFWALLIFGPARTILHQGTYFLPFLFSAAIYVILANINRIILGLSLLFNWLLVSLIWVFPTSSAVKPTNWLSNIDQINYLSLGLYLAVSIFLIIKIATALFANKTEKV